MKRRFSLFALLLALLLALSACGGQPSPQPQQPLTTLQELQELLQRSYRHRRLIRRGSCCQIWRKCWWQWKEQVVRPVRCMLMRR